MRLIRRIVVLLLVIGLVVAGFGYWTATRDPVVREARVAVRDWPAGTRPVRLVLISDLHVAGPDMPPSRLARIVGRINALRPDAVLIAGDFISDKHLTTRIYSFAEIAAPLRQLSAPLGVLAVLGNHDHWVNGPEAVQALSAAGVRVLSNQAARAGPLVIGGLDDDHTGRADFGRTLAAMQMAGGVPVLLSHSPDPFPGLPEDVPLMVAGHTHCGQISLPWIGPLSTSSRHGKRYACGRIDERGRTLVVTAGLGTTMVPVRIGAVPDLWVIELGPAAVRR